MSFCDVPGEHGAENKGLYVNGETIDEDNTWNYLEDYDGTAMPLGNYSQNDDNEYLSQ